MNKKNLQTIEINEIKRIYNSLRSIHPQLLTFSIWQEGNLVFDKTNNESSLDIRTKSILRLIKSFLFLIPYMRIPLNDFMGDLKNMRSLTKSIVSILFGISFGDQALQTLKKPLTSFFPEINTDNPKSKILIEQLLNNTSGLPTIDDFSNMKKLLGTKNWLDTILDYPLVSLPGEEYHYSSANFHLLTHLIQRALGKKMIDHARENLFAKLGIHKFFWNQDSDGVPFGGSDLFLLPGDLLKVGQLFLNKGKFKGKQIVNSKWVNYSTTSQVTIDEVNDYGLGWWIYPNRDSSAPTMYAACGVAGQRIFVIPSQYCIVTATSLTSLYADSSKIDNAVKSLFSQDWI